MVDFYTDSSILFGCYASLSRFTGLYQALVTPYVTRNCDLSQNELLFIFWQLELIISFKKRRKENKCTKLAAANLNFMFTPNLKFFSNVPLYF